MRRSPVVKLCNLIIEEAVALRASDIHIEPFAERIRIRYRIDGVLVERQPARRLLAPMISRLKIMGKMDIARSVAPRTAASRLSSRQPFDLRVGALARPTAGQALVMRILDRKSIQRQTSVTSSFSEEDYQQLPAASSSLAQRHLPGDGADGIRKDDDVVFGLSRLNRPDRKIITAEDPVEVLSSGHQPGGGLRHYVGLDFARIISAAMLRQAPNIILVGEIRDQETAEIAVQASLTGHLVFSTLHTNDAPSAITRLQDIGVAPFLVASSVIAIMGQRLVRMICPKCKEPDQPPAAEIRAAGITPQQAAQATFMRGRGCQNCNHSGFRGRKGIFEMLKLNSAIREMTFNREPAQSLRRSARLHGMRTLLEDGVGKACSGLTTLEEILTSCHAAD